MNRLFFSIQTLLAVVIAGVLCGCISVDYTGKSFPESSRVRYFKERELIPAGEYGIMGRAVVTVRPRTHWDDIQKRILDEARSRGADAVCLTESRSVRHAIFENDLPGEKNWSKFELDPFNPRPGERKAISRKEEKVSDGTPQPPPERPTVVDPESAPLVSEKNAAVRLEHRFLFLKKQTVLDKVSTPQKKVSVPVSTGTESVK